jgi:hypothetical protein
MNRKQRRNVEKKVRTKMTDSQYLEYKVWVLEETINIEIERRVKLIWDGIINDIMVSMKEHRISEERIGKIVSRVVELGQDRDISNARDGGKSNVIKEKSVF